MLVPIPSISALTLSHTVKVGIGLTGLVLISAAQGLVFVPALPTLINTVKESSDDCESESSDAEATAFLGGVFQSVSQLAGALGPLGGQLLLCLFDLSRAEILLGCVLLTYAVILSRCSTTTKVQSEEYEPIPEIVDSLSVALDPSDFDIESLTRTSEPPTRVPAAKRVLFPSVGSTSVDGGEQLYQYGRALVIGKDVDPG